MGLEDDLGRIADSAAAYANGSTVAAVIAAEPSRGERAYLCAFEGADGTRNWLVVDDLGAPSSERQVVRDVVSIAALCEIAAEAAFAGDLDELRSQLVALRMAERPDGIEDAEAAALELQRTIGVPPHLATPARLDKIGLAARRLEQTLDPAGASLFATAMKVAQGPVEGLVREVESAYLGELH